jgi:acetate kinase
VALAGIGIVKDQPIDGTILVLNSGSSSLKFAVYSLDARVEDPLLAGSATGIGHTDGKLEVRTPGGKTLIHRESIHESQSEALAAIAAAIRDHIQTKPVIVGHRVVHGGPKLQSHQVISESVLIELRAAIHFAPLHIPQAISLIESAQSIFPSAVQFACFDNIFHQTMPEVATHLPLPQRYFDAGIRRYGFHGISYESIVHYLGEMLPERIIIAHLGNGASLCAVRNGLSIDTTMGLTPTGGIPMGTRSGDLDPGVLVYLLRSDKLSADDIEELFNHESGLFGLSSGESDVKKLEDLARSGQPGATLALDIFAIAVRKVIGAYVALLGGIDLLVFTGGIGEHSERIRHSATKGLEFLGLTADHIQVIPTQEEKQIARHCRMALKPR